MKLLNGKSLAATIRGEIAEEVKQFEAKGYRAPKLVAVLVGHDGPSETYVNAKVRDCAQVGYSSEARRLPEQTTEKALLELVAELNADEEVDGFIVQLPLPAHINANDVLQKIHPSKDVDGFHPENIGRMALSLPGFVPATPAGIVEMLRREEIETSGKLCVVIGRSKIVGMPMSLLMSQNTDTGNCTVIQTHSRTKNLEKLCAQADILIAALGRPGFVKQHMVKDGAVVIDVGISRVEDASRKKGYALKGDVDFENVAPKCSYITPVPGGVGPMTRTSLLTNTLKAYKRKMGLN